MHAVNTRYMHTYGTWLGEVGIASFVDKSCGGRGGVPKIVCDEIVLCELSTGLNERIG
mgnify:CR=1 FL=1